MGMKKDSPLCFSIVHCPSQNVTVSFRHHHRHSSPAFRCGILFCCIVSITGHDLFAASAGACQYCQHLVTSLPVLGKTLTARAAVAGRGRAVAATVALHIDGVGGGVKVKVVVC